MLEVLWRLNFTLDILLKMNPGRESKIMSPRQDSKNHFISLGFLQSVMATNRLFATSVLKNLTIS